MSTAFSIKDYQTKKVFSSFLPGIAGLYGVPCWVFYCSRGQAICSFGIADKNHAMMEFFPANKSYERVTSHGFRTFIKVDGVIYEPFSYRSANIYTLTTEMQVEQNALSILERNEELQLETTVQYSTVPQENFAALIRQVSIKTLGKEQNLELIDGLPEILPCGINADTVKNMSNTAQAWAAVDWVDDLPIYRTSGQVGDHESVNEVNDGFFFINAHNGTANNKLIVDRSIVFKHCLDLAFPYALHAQPLENLLKEKQCFQNTYASGFAAFQRAVNKATPLNFDSYYGYLNNTEELSSIKERILKKDFASKKIQESKNIVASITSDIETQSSYPFFDEYCKQNYLDNLLRGGYPLVFENKKKKTVYHVYSRKHGDLERDYNFFYLEPSPLSQGNANFRDICQNRRNDVYFHPEAGLQNVLRFLSLIQADGYNPLNIRGLECSIDLESYAMLEEELGFTLDAKFKTLLASFTPGRCYQHLKENYFQNKLQAAQALSKIMSFTSFSECADYVEGFWIDHFSYSLDLIESYLEVYPEELPQLLFRYSCKYFDSPARVRSRKEKYTVIDGRLRQLDAVEFLHEKEKLNRERGHNFLVDEEGALYTGSLFEKLLCLVCNKISALDPWGLGIEMEAGKPGWNDSLNGLPSILGSGVSELFEVKRIIEFLLRSLTEDKYTVNALIHDFAKALTAIFTSPLSEQQRWDRASTERERFREQVGTCIKAEKIQLDRTSMQVMLNSFSTSIQAAIEKASNYQAGIIPSFFEYIVALPEGKVPVNLETLPFEARALPLFLEAPTKSMSFNTKEENRKLYRQIKASKIYDEKLKMYKTSESLEQEGIGIGRARSFAPGWLEREAVFMHMEFKYLLQLLKTGLYDEFYATMKTTLPCFLDPDVYGRSIFENSSFIASSVHPNSDIHGQGFSARLSGSTAEFLSIWKILFFGNSLFSYDTNDVTLRFQISPKLHASFFRNAETVRSKLFSCINLEIVNPNAVHCYETLPSSINIVLTNGEAIHIKGCTVSGELAAAIRQRTVSTITVTYK